MVSFDNNVNGVTNTFSSWSPSSDNNGDNTNRFNNIADFDAGYVDVLYDWGVATGSNRPGNWKIMYKGIDKKVSDLYRHNSGYRNGYVIPSVFNAWAVYNYTLAPTFTTFNCSKLSTRIWSDVMNESGYSNPIDRDQWLPSYVYDQIP